MGISSHTVRFLMFVVFKYLIYPITNSILSAMTHARENEQRRKMLARLLRTTGSFKRHPPFPENRPINTVKKNNQKKHSACRKYRIFCLQQCIRYFNPMLLPLGFPTIAGFPLYRAYKVHTVSSSSSTYPLQHTRFGNKIVGVYISLSVMS